MRTEEGNYIVHTKKHTLTEIQPRSTVERQVTGPNNQSDPKCLMECKKQLVFSSKNCGTSIQKKEYYMPWFQFYTKHKILRMKQWSNNSIMVS